VGAMMQSIVYPPEQNGGGIFFPDYTKRDPEPYPVGLRAKYMTKLR